MSSSRTDTTVDVLMPQMGVSVAEGTVLEWRKSVGDAVEADETICEISTDKIDSDLPAPAGGRVAEILVGAGQTVAVGTVLARIERSAGAQRSPEVPAGRHAVGAAAPRFYSPVARRIAAAHGVDLEAVVGTGRGGRVRKQDVLAAVAANGANGGPRPLHIESPYEPEPAESARLSHTRRTIGERMLRSLATAPHCTTIVEVDMSAIERARARLGLTYLPLVARCTIDALRDHPALNATLDGDFLTRHTDVNLGIAVSLGDDGLIVPVIRRAQLLSAEGLAEHIRDAAERARNRTLSPDEVGGGTFTITNPGAFGAIAATPIINQPQVAILDLEAVVKRPVVVSGADGTDTIAIRPIANLCLSWDHRALDGALAAQFLGAVKRHAESWSGG